MHFFVILVLVLFQNPAQRVATQDVTTHTDNKPTNGDQTTTADSGPREKNKESQTHQSEGANDYDPRTDCLYRWYLRFTIVGVCGALVGIGVLGYQASLMKISTNAATDAAKAAEDAAKATHKTVDAMVNSERPWITATIRKMAKDTTHVTFERTRAPRDRSWFHFVLKNVGRTPAEIRAVRGNPQITSKGIDNGLTTESKPDYGLPFGFRQTRLLAPGQEWILYDVDLSLTPYSDTEVEQITESKAHIFFAGLVIYRDTLRPEVDHETSFCYTYLTFPDEYVPSGPPQYTKYT